MFLRNWARLYSYQTAPEVSLEVHIAALGRRYRSQHPFWSIHCISDFVLVDDKVVIEVDGKSHNTPQQKAKDLKHTLALEKLGYTVVRCSNEEATSDPAGTVARMMALAAQKSRLEVAPTLQEIARLEAVVASKTCVRQTKPRLAKGKRSPGRPKTVRGHGAKSASKKAPPVPRYQTLS